MMRGAGVLLPVFSLPSPAATGNFGSEAYEFIDFLQSAGQKYWQVLPLVNPDPTHSPYQSCSAFAGSVFYISPELLSKEGLVDYTPSKHSKRNVNYEEACCEADIILRKAFRTFEKKEDSDFKIFCLQNDDWLENYASFTAIKDYYGGSPWYEWDHDISLRNEKRLNELKTELASEITFHKFCQYEFHRQWKNLKEYANEKNIRIIGDIPIYVSYDSADVWNNPELFALDRDLRPVASAGVPPDMFSSTGQLWGNPLYNWNAMEQADFSWWKKRIHHNSILYDVIRIDHFIGIVNYYAVPYGDKTAMNGTWLKGPGKKLIKAINQSRQNSDIIAEDLGLVTPEVTRVLKKSGYPGMKLMISAFDGNPSNESLPHNFEKNCVVYGGTHDNETLAGFFSGQKGKSVNFAKSYLDVGKKDDIPWGIIKSAYASCADLAVFQFQDYAGLDNDSRINTPSTTEGNWCFRAKKELFSQELAKKMKRLAEIYDR